MSQVIVEMGYAASAGAGKANVYPANMRSAEITSSATSQQASLTADLGEICTIANNGADTIWVKFGSNPTAAVTDASVIPPNTTRDFGPLELGAMVAVINDS